MATRRPPRTSGSSRPGSDVAAARRPVTEATPPIGVTLSTVGVTASWWLDAAARLDAAGVRAIWSWDHVMGRGDPTVPVLEAWTMLGAAASRTSRASLGTFVANVMNRHPAMLARMASTLQEVAGGPV